jgi:hypothetical protein
LNRTALIGGDASSCSAHIDKRIENRLCGELGGGLWLVEWHAKDDKLASDIGVSLDGHDVEAERVDEKDKRRLEVGGILLAVEHTEIEEIGDVLRVDALDEDARATRSVVDGRRRKTPWQ